MGPASQFARESVRPRVRSPIAMTLGDDEPARAEDKKTFPSRSILSRSILTPRCGDLVPEQGRLTNHGYTGTTGQMDLTVGPPDLASPTTCCLLT